MEMKNKKLHEAKFELNKVASKLIMMRLGVGSRASSCLHLRSEEGGHGNGGGGGEGELGGVVLLDFLFLSGASVSGSCLL